MQFLYYVFGPGVKCLILYCLVCLNVSFSKLITSFWEERAIFTRIFVVSVRRSGALEKLRYLSLVLMR